MKKKPTVRSVTSPCSNQCADTPKKLSASISQGISVDHSPIEARHQQPSDSSINSTPVLSTLPSPKPSSAQSEGAHESPDLSKCLDIEYEYRDFVPGVSYRTIDGEEGWTPVVKKRRIRRGRTSGSSDSESDESGSEVDISCSRLVEFEKREGIPGLMIYRRGPPTWTPIRSATKMGPIASRTRSKTAKT